MAILLTGRDYLKPGADGNYDCSDPALEHALDAMKTMGKAQQGRKICMHVCTPCNITTFSSWLRTDHQCM